VILRPNITTAGRWVRGISGAVLLVIGAALLWFSWPASPLTRWIVASLLMLLGAFQIFEARKSWCVLRACRIKTPV
jgi:hypothetical protein